MLIILLACLRFVFFSPWWRYCALNIVPHVYCDGFQSNPELPLIFLFLRDSVHIRVHAVILLLVFDSLFPLTLTHTCPVAVRSVLCEMERNTAPYSSPHSAAAFTLSSSGDENWCHIELSVLVCSDLHLVKACEGSVMKPHLRVRQLKAILF